MTVNKYPNGIETRGRIAARTALVIAVACMASVAVAQKASVDVDGIEKQLSQLYQTAKATADGTDLVTAGSVLVLQKDHLIMSKVETPFPTPNAYKNGAITQNGFVAAGRILQSIGKLGGDPAAAGGGATREFVTGEKFWVIKIDTRSDGVAMTLMSDPIKDIRYHALLKFPFAKGTSPSPDDVASTVSEVIKIDQDSGGDQAASGQQGGAAAPVSPAAPKTIAIGQTRDQVIAQFGVPNKVVRLGSKEIDIFPDMKVTFVQDKVTDVK